MNKSKILKALAYTAALTGVVFLPADYGITILLIGVIILAKETR